MSVNRDGHPTASPPLANEDLKDAFQEALGEHAALIVNHMDKWFERLLTQQATASVSGQTGQGADSAAPAGRLNDLLKSLAPQIPSLGAVTSPTPAPLPTEFETFKSYDLKAFWSGWAFHQSASLRPGGVVEIKQDKSTPGVLSEPISLERQGLIQIQIDCDCEAGEPIPKLALRAIDERDRRIAQDLELEPGLNTKFLFVGYRTKSIQLYIIVTNPKIGLRFTLTKVEAATVDLDHFYARRRLAAVGPAIASMATIPQRRAMLQDCVASLLLQCDRVRVFLNNYPDVPAFLNHPRIDIRRSQDWDDKGDAGKFGWIEEKDEPGYRIIVDDDLVFPPDFVEKMSRKVKESANKAIYGMHGVILKQPVVNYYDPDSRSVFHFQYTLKFPRTCHVLGTNALCYYSEAVKMTWADFMYRNMADIFVAQYAQRHGLPMITPERDAYWVRQNDQDGGFETIYDNSLRKSRSGFDSSRIQDALIKHSYPLTFQPTSRLKVALIWIVFEKAEFDEALKSWEATCFVDNDWALILINGSGGADVSETLSGVQSPNELHIVDRGEGGGARAVSDGFALAQQIGFDLLCIASDRLRFSAGRWAQSVARLIKTDGRKTVFISQAEDNGALRAGPHPMGQSFPLFAAAGRDCLAQVGIPDPSARSASSSLWGWLQALSQSNSTATPFPDKMSEALLESFAAATDALKTPKINEKRHAAPLLAEPAVFGLGAMPALSINGFFKKVFVINLDRRPDRWSRMKTRLDAADIEAERFVAEDGSSPEHEAAYAAYSRSPLIDVSNAMRPVAASKQFYQDYDSENARVAYVEKTEKKKAIRSAGAWGYLKTWEKILERVLDERIETTLVLDDDVVFHRNAGQLFAAAVGGLPEDWMVLQLGSLQHHWTPDWITWHNRFLYRTNGLAVGSHAVGIKFDVAPFMLEHVRRMLLPFDTGVLAMTTRAFANRCYVAFPHIAIQSLGEFSDISTSEFQKVGDRQKIANTYRWDLSCYDE